MIPYRVSTGNKSEYVINLFPADTHFTLSNARWFYSSKGDPLGSKGLKNYLPQPFPAQDQPIDFTLSNARRFYSSKGRPLGQQRVKKPFPAQDQLMDFTLSNAKWFYSTKGDPLGSKGLKNYLPQPFPAQDRLIHVDFTLSNTRQFYLSKRDPLGSKGLMVLTQYLPPFCGYSHFAHDKQATKLTVHCCGKGI